LRSIATSISTIRRFHVLLLAGAFIEISFA
jgi:hypothetical protein